MTGLLELAGKRLADLDATLPETTFDDLLLRLFDPDEDADLPVAAFASSL